MEGQKSEALAKRVGKHFLVNYYQVLHDTPELLHKFYQEDSVFCVGSEGEQNSDIKRSVGPENINQKIQSLGFTNCRVRLSTVEAQDSVAGSVIILVKGTMTNNGGAPTDFVQSFVLAEQQPSGYYVRNDILRYLSASAPAQPAEQRTETTPEKVEETPKKESPAAPASEHKPEAHHDSQAAQATTPAPAQAPVASTPTPAQQPQPAAAPEAKTEAAPSKEESEDEDSDAEEAKEAEPPAKAPSKPAETEKAAATSSWAALAARAASNPQPAAKPATPAQKKPAQPKPQGDEEHEQRSGSTGITSLYVSNLPYSCTKTQIDEIFGAFGEIKVTALPANKGYAFIEYVNPESVLKAIKETNEKVTLEGRVLKVEMRKNKHGKDRQGGRRPNKDRKEGGEHADKEQGGEHKEKKANGVQKQQRPFNNRGGGGQKKTGGNRGGKTGGQGNQKQQQNAGGK